METPSFEKDNQKRFWNAALQLHYSGFGVTTQKIQSRVGGSMRDIAPIVKKFNEYAEQATQFAAVPLPEALEQRIQNTLKTIAGQLWTESQELAKAEVLQIKSDHEEIQAELKAKSEEATATATSWQKEAGRLDVAVGDLKKEITALKADKESLRTQLDQAKRALDKLDIEHQDKTSKLSETSSALSIAKDQLERERGNTEVLTAERNLLSDRVTDLESSKMELMVKASQFDELERRKNSLQEDYETQRKLTDRLSEENSRIEAENTRVTSELAKQITKMDKLELSFKDLQATRTIELEKFKSQELKLKQLEKALKPINDESFSELGKGIQKLLLDDKEGKEHKVAPKAKRQPRKKT